MGAVRDSPLRSVMALDLGRSMGVATNLDGHRECFTVTMPPGDRAASFASLSDWLADAITDYEPKVVIFERPFSRGLPATRYLWGCAAIVECVLYRREVLSLDVVPSFLKKFATGDGKAKKPAMIAAANACGWQAKNDHEADAAMLVELLLAKGVVT